MKWRKNKPSSSSSSSSSRFLSLSRVLPTTWLSSFKRMSVDSEVKPAKQKQVEMKNSMPVNSSKFASGGDAEAFWRLSFGEDNSVDGKTSKTVSRSAWYESDDELDFVPSNCRTCGINAMRMKEKKETNTLNNMVYNVRQMKEYRRDMQILPDINIYRENATVLKTPRSRMIMEKEMKSKKINGRVRSMEEKRLNRQYKSGEAQPQCRSARSVEKNTLEKGDYQRKHPYPSTMNLRASNLTTINEDYGFKAQKLVDNDVFSPEEVSSDGEKWKGKKIEKLKQRKSVYMSRELPRRMKHNHKVRVFSPRTASKIKALENMKKAKLKMKAEKHKPISQRTELENFAMVKCSFDPEKDFRDSMMEMIRVNRISQPGELEELLACYLTLNSDVYHDLIIKVFQQVWFEMDQANSEIDFQNEQCSF